MPEAVQLRLLRLNSGEIRDSDLFRLEKGWRVHFVLGPSLAAIKVRVFTNHPEKSYNGPNRHLYRELRWRNYSDSDADIYDNYAELYIGLAGSFNYYFTIDGSSDLSAANGRGYLLVDPVLRVGPHDERLPLDAITCQSLLAKALGKFPEWLERLRVSKESGYNCIHLTPLQKLGMSGSSYCIYDQLTFNDAFSPPEQLFTFKDVEQLIDKIKVDWSMLSMSDLVLNHTAVESPWILEHPECTFNLVNSPHLRPAYLLDRIIWHFSVDISIGKYTQRGLPPEIRSDEHLEVLHDILYNMIIPRYKLYEFYQMDIDDVVASVHDAIKSGRTKSTSNDHSLYMIHDPLYRRNQATINIAEAIKLHTRNESATFDESSLRRELTSLNHRQRDMMDMHLRVAMTNIIANTRWRFIDPGGPRVPAVQTHEPIMWNFFVLPKTSGTIEEEEQATYMRQSAQHMAAHNGWVMNDDPLKNFAEPGSNVYLRRELIPWGDNVKLRFGNEPSDCPFLWDYMARYASEMARIFHGVRLDNCHSTPIHVAEYILDEARKVRPDLYVVAELFTNSTEKDNVFINRLGLTSLVREAMNAWDAHELGRLVHRFGGEPVGSFLKPPARVLMPSMAHAMFLDQTHDNPSPLEKKSALDVLPTSAMVAMACCATGSNRGYDEFVPEHINVVKDSRLYASWTNKDSTNAQTVNLQTGLIGAKRALNKLHNELALTGFTQLYVDKVASDVVAVTRHNSVNHQNVIMVTRSAFEGQKDAYNNLEMTFPGILDEVLLEAWTELGPSSSYRRNSAYIGGIRSHVVRLREHIPPSTSHLLRVGHVAAGEKTHVTFHDFTPGCVIAFRMTMDTPTRTTLLRLRQCLGQFGYRMPTYSGRHLAEISCSEIENVVSELDSSAINRALYRCGSEEKDSGHGFDVYGVPGYGPLPYCGLQGVVSLLNKIRPENDLGHPLCVNLRDGNWLPNYIANRLKCYPETENLGKWFEKIFKDLNQIPRYLIPAYFDAIVTGVYTVIEEVAWAKMSDFVKNGSSFTRSLAMGSLQFCSVVNSASLPPFSPSLKPFPVSGDRVSVSDDRASVNGDQASMSVGRPSVTSERTPVTVNAGRPSVISETASAGRPSVISEQASVSAGRPSVISEQASVSAGRPSVISEQALVSAGRASVASDRPSVVSEQVSIKERASLNERASVKKRLSVDERGGTNEQAAIGGGSPLQPPTLSAGLPHFASGLFRNWGRDTFIAVRGCLLLTGRHSEVRHLILGFASTLRHGLIPNLLGAGTHARFNCRDATWWWLECIQQYVSMVPGGAALLEDTVSRMYPTDDSHVAPPGQHDQPLYDVIQEALQKHAMGIKFRERNAGSAIDSEMQSQGFDVEVRVDWNTGFIHGGNKYNCGTWMDKMGSSQATNNKGWPATPRDGAAVEIVGLSRSALRWLNTMYKKKKYPYNSVKRNAKDGQRITFKEWGHLIDVNFEKQFWISSLGNANDPHQKLINQRMIYKDTVGSYLEYGDYQLRPNYPIAMVVAPEMFNAHHAWLALSMIEKYLQGPLGLKTLDPSDWGYNGNYDNNDESRGFNYHQGPEWVWPMGYYLRAKLFFAAHQGDSGLLEKTVRWTEMALNQHNVHLHRSLWKSLPELTNANGQECAHSCPAQAWSMGCILEVVYDLNKIVERKQ